MRSNFRKNLTYKVGPEPIVIRRVYFQGAFAVSFREATGWSLC